MKRKVVMMGLRKGYMRILFRIWIRDSKAPPKSSKVSSHSETSKKTHLWRETRNEKREERHNGHGVRGRRTTVKKDAGRRREELDKASRSVYDQTTRMSRDALVSGKILQEG
jgi:hypothetical protein